MTSTKTLLSQRCLRWASLALHAAVLTFAGMAAQAAPLTTPADLPAGKVGDATQQSGHALSEASAVSESQGQSRTVRMLLEMQNAPAPLEGTGQSKREEEARAKAARLAASPETVITAPEGAAVVDWRAGLPGRNVNASRVAEASTAAPTGAPVQQRPLAGDTVNLREVLPDTWFSYLRANREWVLLGGLAALALAWLVATAFSRR